MKRLWPWFALGVILGLLGIIIAMAELSAQDTAHVKAGRTLLIVVDTALTPAPLPAPVAAVTVSPAATTVTVGALQQLTVLLKDVVGGVLTGRVVTWASSVPAVATVTATGLVSGVTAGTATITATSEGKSGSAGVTVVPPPPPPPPTAGVIWASDWSFGLGYLDNIVRDGGKWDFADIGGYPTIAVVVAAPSPPGGGNSLRIQNQGPTANGWVWLRKENVLPPSKDFYVRFYFRNDDVGGASQDHIVEPSPWQNATYNELTYLNKADFATGWRPRLALGCQPTACPWAGGAAMPNWDLGEDPGALAYAKWYRFEFFVHWTTTTRVQVHIRIYDDTGALRWTDSNFVADPGWGVWPGATLASYYAGTNPTGGPKDFGVSTSNLVNFAMGNNGSGSSTYTGGLYWYYAKVALCTAWCGP